MQTIAAWLSAHHALVVASWLAFSGFVLAVFKQRTPEAEAAFEAAWPRLAAFVKAVDALGIDPVQLVTSIGKLAKGAPKGPIVLLLVIAISSSACTPGARWAVADLLAEKIACAVAHQDMSAEDIAKACAIEPGDLTKVMAIVEKSREKSAERAAQASAAKCAGTP